MAGRKSPDESATLFKVDTKKKGNDGNMWIVKTNKIGVKRWVKISDKPAGKTYKIKDISVLSLYDIPTIKIHNWKKWLENLSAGEQKFIEKVRSSYKKIEESTGIKVIECILPINDRGYYWIDYVWDYAGEKNPNLYDNDVATIIVVIKLDKDFHINIGNNMISCQHINIKKEYKTKFLEFIEQFNKEKYGKISWNGKNSGTINFVLE